MRIRRSYLNIQAVVITLLIISNICFYTMDTLQLYLAMNLSAILLEGIRYIQKGNFRRVRIHRCVVWLIVIYTVFTINGLYRLRSGDYNADMMIFTCAQNIVLFLAFSEIVEDEHRFELLRTIIYTSAVISLSYLIASEMQNFITGGIRIGDSLSGNVNVAGANFGILSEFLAYICTKDKTKFSYILFGTVAAIMLLTGSKMSIILLVLDLLFFIKSSKNKVNTFLIVFIVALIMVFAVFTIPFFYNIIGVRIEDMIFSLFGVGKGVASHSTDVRKVMIQEGFRFFWDHPIIGGGEKYFATRTSTIYGYSHCNYVEILCNAGIIGFLLYFGPLFKNLKKMISFKNKDASFMQLAITLLIGRFFLDWMQVTYSEPCVGYIPMIFSFVYIEYINKIVNFRLGGNN